MPTNFQTSAQFEKLESRRLFSATLLSAITLTPIKQTDNGLSITSDSSDNIIVGGTYANTTDFDPGAGVHNLTPVRKADVFVAKYSPGKTLLWVRTIGNRQVNTLNRVETDEAGNVYLSGVFSRPLAVDNGHGGTFTLTSEGGADPYIIKYNANGTLAYARSFGGGFEDTCTSLAVTPHGDVYLAGQFILSADLAPGPQKKFVEAQNTSDVYIEKLDTSGNLLWVHTYHGDPTQRSLINVMSLTTNSSGGLWATGQFRSPINFGSAAKPHFIDGNGGDAFILHLSSNGGFGWVDRIGHGANTTPKSLVADASGNIYTVGQFTKTGDFAPGSKTSLLSAQSNSGFGDIYIERINSNGGFGWARDLGNDNGDSVVTSLALDTAGNPYFAGYFTNFMDMNPGAGTLFFNNNSGEDNTFSDVTLDTGANGFYEKLTAGGAFAFARKIGGDSGDLSINDVRVDSSGTVLLTGIFAGAANLDPGAGHAFRTADSDGEAFILRVDEST